MDWYLRELQQQAQAKKKRAEAKKQKEKEIREEGQKLHDQIMQSLRKRPAEEITLDEIGVLSVRSFNWFKAQGFKTLAELISWLDSPANKDARSTRRELGEFLESSGDSSNAESFSGVVWLNKPSGALSFI